MFEFFGHLHPALVHLPIGILLMALLLMLLARNERYKISQQVIKVVLLIGMLSAVLSCITGYLLSVNGDYEKSLVSWHMWMGIGVAIASMLLYVRVVNKQFDVVYKSLAFAVLALVFVTGHLGGELTHGSDFIPFSFGNSEKEDTIAVKPIANVQEAVVYADIIQPIFQKNCYSCHNKNKQKGGLRIDDMALLLKGGKDGKVLLPGKADESDLIKRLLLPNGDEHHMPPKQKPQLNEKQIALIHWWIENGADAQKQVKLFAQPEKIKPFLLALQTDHIVEKAPANIPSASVEKADVKAVQALQDKGVILMPVAQNSNYLMANFVNADSLTDKDLALLLPIKKQLVWLKLGDTKITDSAAYAISQCNNLTELQLNNTAITDKTLQQLKALINLQTLNLVGTAVTAQGVIGLSSLPQLRSLFLYKTKVEAKDWAQLQRSFPKTTLDSGGYQVPLLTTDTTIVKAKS